MLFVCDAVSVLRRYWNPTTNESQWVPPEGSTIPKKQECTYCKSDFIIKELTTKESENTRASPVLEDSKTPHDVVKIESTTMLDFLRKDFGPKCV